MIKELMHDPIFLACKSEDATKEDITIILLHLIDDLKFDDIALKLNKKVKTIKTKYYRALKKYQKMKGVK